MTDIVLVSVPRLNPAPQYGLWLLQNQIAAENFKVKIFDANIDLYHMFGQNSAVWKKLEVWGIQQQDWNDTDSELKQILTEIFSTWADHILNLYPATIGISVFTHESRNWTQWLCYHIKLKNPSVRIILGGRGLNNPGKPQADFAEQCRSWQLCDKYFNGESEVELIKWLKGQPCIINNHSQFTINDQLDVECFDRPDLSKYTLDSTWYDDRDVDSNHQVIPDNSDKKYKMFSTRGCVKTCTFCDVHLARPKFSMRSSTNVFDEIRYAVENYGVKEISFTDDMINGSNRQFMQWLEMLAKYLDQHKILDFSWGSQFGIKDRRSTPQGLFDLLAQTNAQLTIGVDHLSDSVLEHMQKKYCYQDIVWFFEQGKNLNYRYQLLLFVLCYPSEQLIDFDLLYNRVIELSQYRDQINLWDFGTTCNIPVGSVLESLPGMHLGNTQILWTWDSNPSLTTKEKQRRRSLLEKLGEQLMLPVRKKQTQNIRMQAWMK
jgi:hypothetical protein